MYYLPTWVCGKYDATSHSTIIYNLIAGLSFFFEDLAADIVGIILSNGKNSLVDEEKIYLSSGLDKEDIDDFLKKLFDYGLLSTTPSDQETIDKYRNHYLTNHYSFEKPTEGSTEIIQTTSSAENAYIKRTKTRAAIVMFELTYSCSEKCIHCYNPNVPRNEEDLNIRGREGYINIQKYKSIIDELVSLGTIKVCLTGGDPFSHPDIWEIIDYLFQKNIAFEIFTNAQAIFGIEKKLANYFPVSVAVSIYSTRPEVHDSITRIKGSFKKSVEVLERMHQLCVPLVIKCVIMQPNISSYYGIRYLAEKLNATIQFDCRLIDSVDGDRCIRDCLRLTSDQLKVVYRDKLGMYYVGPEALDYGKLIRKPNEPACLTGNNNLCITPQGYVIPCCCFHSIIGNVYKQSISKILKSKSLEQLMHITLSDYEECGRYPYCDFCVLCPGINHNENGTPLKAAENNCYYAKIRYQVYCDLQAGIDPLNGKSIEDRLEHMIPSHKKITKKIIKNYLDTYLEDVL